MNSSMFIVLLFKTFQLSELREHLVTADPEEH